jgi:hypothetical protein
MWIQLSWCSFGDSKVKFEHISAKFLKFKVNNVIFSDFDIIPFNILITLSLSIFALSCSFYRVEDFAFGSRLAYPHSSLEMGCRRSVIINAALTMHIPALTMAKVAILARSVKAASAHCAKSVYAADERTQNKKSRHIVYFFHPSL